MKKIFLIMLILSYGFGSIYSQNCSPFKVTKPANNSVNWIGFDMNIKWMYKSPVPKRKIPPAAQKQNKQIIKIPKIKLVRIEFKLVKPVILKLMNWRTISASTPDDGSFVWKIPPKLRKGVYIIRVIKLWCSSGDPDRIAVSKEFKLAKLTR